MFWRPQEKKQIHIQPNQGFSILELMIVIAIIGLLAAWSYPHYIHTIQRTECRRGQLALQQIANRIERYATLHGSYLGANRDNIQINALEQQTQYHYIITSISAHHYNILGTSQQKNSSTACQSISLEGGTKTTVQ